MPKYGVYAKAVELLCFKPALARLAAFASSEKGKAALNSFPAFAIWTNAAIKTTVACLTAQKRLQEVTIAAIFTLQGLNDFEF